MPEDKISRSIYNKSGSIHEHIEKEIVQRQQKKEQEQEKEQKNLDAMEMKKKKKKALLEFRCRVEDSILSNYLLGKNYRPKENENLRDIKLWGVPLLPSRGHKATDVVLMKFLKARDYKVSDAFNMLRKTMKWRHDHNVDAILDENFSSDLQRIGYIDGTDKGGHPLCYQTFEVFKTKDVLRKRFGTKESCDEFIRWRIQLMEKCISKLDFKPGGVDSVIQIIDLKHISRTTMRALVRISKRYLPMLQENYPGIVFRYVIVNVPIWFLALYTLHLRLTCQKYKIKALFVRPARVTDTLLKFIAPENIPVQYGGLSRNDNNEFSRDDKVLERRIKGSATEHIQIPTTEAGMTIFWDMTVVGYEVSYKEEFVPDDECSYRVLLQKGKQIGKSVSNSFHITEPGKIVITFENAAHRRRRVFYRYKIKPTVPMYILLKKDHE